MRNLITNWRLDSWPLLIPMKDSSIFWLDYSVSIHFSLPRNFKRRQRCFFSLSNLLPETTWKASREFWQIFFPRTDLAFVHAICLSETHQYWSHLDGACCDISTIDVFVSWKKNTHTSDVGSCIETLPKLHIQALYRARESVSTKTYKDFHVTCVGVVL